MRAIRITISLRRAVTLAMAGLLVVGCTTGGVPATQPPVTATDGASSPNSATSEPTAATTGLPTPEQTSVKIGTLGLTISNLPQQIAYDLGLFEKYGLDVELLPFDGDPAAAQALQAGQVDVTWQSAGPAIASQTTDAPLIVVMVLRTNLTDVFVGRSDIETADDLRDQPVAVSGFGASSHGVVKVALSTLGLSDDDVVITQIGNDSARRAALTAGSVAAAPLDGSLVEELRGQGFNILVDLTTRTDLGWPRSALVTTREYNDANPGTIQALVAAQLEALQIMFDDPDTAVRVWQEESGLTEEEAREQYDLLIEQGWAPRTGRTDVEKFQALQNLQAEVEPAVGEVDVNQVFTTEYVDRLEELGYFERFGVPTE